MSRCSPRASQLTALPVRPEPLAALMAHFLFALGVERRRKLLQQVLILAELFCRAISADVAMSNFQYSEARTFPVSKTIFEQVSPSTWSPVEDGNARAFHLRH